MTIVVTPESRFGYLNHAGGGAHDRGRLGAVPDRLGGGQLSAGLVGAGPVLPHRGGRLAAAASGVRQLRANLAQVTGAAPDNAEVRRLARLGVHSYLRYWREFFQLSGARPPVTFEGLDQLPVAGSRRGAILALPHSGNWDLAGAALAELGHPITTVGQRLRPEALYQRFVADRAAVGIEVLPVDEPRRTAPALGRRLAVGGVACLLADRDVTGAGLPVRLHGRATTMPAGPARLALSTGAALIPVSLWYSGRGLRVHLHEEIVVPLAAGRRAQAMAMTQALADVFTDAIRRHPQDWHVLQPVWPTTADLDRPATVAVGPPTADLGPPGRRRNGGALPGR
ncbi:phosphatidylinositol mannoside acyltransferase [Micromonospora chersina]|uniref:phosphatidylinositol mannoside acyltransferase n=1 Tax=Micromonospora chersina TaxID=47854 RepID=UPI0034524E20